MKNLKVTAYLIGIVLAGVAVAMAFTNPDRSAYEAYATQQLTKYLRQNACTDADESLQAPCQALLNSGQPQIRQFIAANTDRQNYGVLSIYTTDLSLGSSLPFLSQLVPSYHFETVGIFQTFYTYEAEERK